MYRRIFSKIFKTKLIACKQVDDYSIIIYNSFQFQFDQEEPKEEVKEKPKVGKLKMGAFGGGAEEPAAAAPAKRSWKKKE